MPGKDAPPPILNNLPCQGQPPLKAASSFQGGGGMDWGTRIDPELHSGLLILNHSVVSLGPGLVMYAGEPMSLPHSGHRPFAGHDNMIYIQKTRTTGKLPAISAGDPSVAPTAPIGIILVAGQARPIRSRSQEVTSSIRNQKLEI